MAGTVSETPRVSVVVIVLNGAGGIGACLEALTRQDYPRDRYEIIVVDNGSTDATVELVKRYPVRVVHEVRRGYARARNAGVKVTTGEIVAFTDADCLAEPEWLRELARPYCDPGVGAVGGRGPFIRAGRPGPQRPSSRYRDAQASLTCRLNNPPGVDMHRTHRRYHLHRRRAARRCRAAGWD